MLGDRRALLLTIFVALVAALCALSLRTALLSIDGTAEAATNAHGAHEFDEEGTEPVTVEQACGVDLVPSVTVWPDGRLCWNHWQSTASSSPSPVCLRTEEEAVIAKAIETHACMQAFAAEQARMQQQALPAQLMAFVSSLPGRVASFASRATAALLPFKLLPVTAADAACSMHGVLVNGRCQCDDGWLKQDCSLSFDFQTNLDAFNIKWTYNASSLFVQFRSANAGGWLGAIVGSDDGGMSSGDTWLAWVDTAGVGQVRDAWATGTSQPSASETQNLVAPSGWIISGITQVSFSRLLTTGDNNRDYQIVPNPNCLLNWGTNNVAKPTASSFSRHDDHGNGGAFTIDWLKTKAPPSAPNPPTQTGSTAASITLSFAAPTAPLNCGYLSGFSVQRESTPGSGTYTEAYNGMPGAPVSGTYTTTISGLAGSSTYGVRVAAICTAQGVGAYSSPTSMSTATPASNPPSATGAPTLSSRTVNSLTVAWTAATANGSPITAYAVQFSASSATGPWTAVGPNTLSPLSRTIPGLAVDANYWVQVQALSAAGPGPWSTATQFRTANYPPCANPTCNGHGTCFQGNCQCAAGWLNSNCTLRADFNFVAPGGQYKLYWTYDASSIYAQMVATTTGWVGVNFGASSSCGMCDADTWQGYVTAGVATVRDMYATTTTTPSASETQNLFDTSGYENGGSTYIYLRRLLTTTDTAKDKAIVSGVMPVSWAYGSSDSFGQHAPGCYGMTSLEFLQPKGAPSVPRNVALASATQTSLTIQWAAPQYSGSGTLNSFTVQRETSPGSGTYSNAYSGLPTPSGGLYSTTISGLTSGGTYGVRVAASNDFNGLGAYSTAVQMTTLTNQAPPDAPAAPTLASATATSISISWTAPATHNTPITGYNVRYATSASGPFTNAPSTGASVTTATISGLAASTTYFVQVAATSLAGTSAWSASGQLSTTAYSACPDGCSGHGVCVTARCQCDVGFVGAACSMPTTGMSCMGSGSAGAAATGNICLRWTHDSTNVYFQAESYAGLSKWYGFIVQPDVSNGMSNGDAWVFLPNAGVSAATVGDALTAQDRWSSGTTTPVMDTVQNFVDVVTFVRPAFSTYPDALVVQFTRAQNTGDSTQDRPIVAGNTRLSWAVGSALTFGEHTHTASTQGRVVVDFLEAFVTGPPNPPQWKAPAFLRATNDTVSVKFAPPELEGSSPVSAYTVYILQSASLSYVMDGSFAALSASDAQAYVQANLAQAATSVPVPANASATILSNLARTSCFPVLATASNTQGASAFSAGLKVCTLKPSDNAPPAPPTTDVLLDAASAQPAPGSSAPPVSTSSNALALTWPALASQLANTSDVILVGWNVQVQLLSSSGDVPRETAWVDVSTCFPTAEPTCTVAALHPGAVYAVRLQTQNIVGEGAWSEPVLLRTAAQAPCLNACSGEGRCVNSVCECLSPFLGDDCSVKGSVAVLSKSPYFAMTFAVAGQSTAPARRLLQGGGSPYTEPTMLIELAVADGAGDLSFDAGAWAGLMFFPQGNKNTDGMSGGDVFSVSFDAPSTPSGVSQGHVWDRFSRAREAPRADVQQDVIPSSIYTYATAPGEARRIRFARNVRSTDHNGEDVDVPSALVSASWARGPGIAAAAADLPPTMLKHGVKGPSGCGKFRLNFFTGEVELPEDMSMKLFWPMAGALVVFCLVSLCAQRVGPLRRTTWMRRIVHQPMVHVMRTMWNPCFGAPIGAPKSGYRQSWMDMFTLDVRRVVGETTTGEVLLLAAYAAALGVIIGDVKASLEQAGTAFNYVLGDLTALHLALALLPVSRRSIFLLTCGISFERAVKWHRWSARVATALMLSHFLTMYSRFPLDTLLAFPAVETAYGKGNIYGFIAGLAMAISALFAIEPIRRNAFRLFFYVHLTMIPIVYVCACLHSTTALYLCAIPLALYIADRLWRTSSTRLLCGNTRVLGVEIIDVDVPDAASSGGVADAPSKPATCIVHLQLRREGFRFSPGQYVWLNIGSVSHVDWHPFSISSASEVSDGSFSLHILAQCNGVAHLKAACNHFKAGGKYGVRTAPGIVSVGHVIASPLDSKSYNSNGNNGDAEAQNVVQSVVSDSAWETLPLASRTWTGELLAQTARYVARCSSNSHSNTTLLSGSAVDSSAPSAAGGLQYPPFSVLIDGPYGKPCLRFEEFSTVILVAGGIGITPCFSLLYDLLARVQAGNCRVTRVHLVWICSDAHVFALMHPALWARLQAASNVFRLHFYATRGPQGGDASLNIQSGRPKWPELFPSLLRQHYDGSSHYPSVSSPSAVASSDNQQSSWQSNPAGSTSGLSVEMSDVRSNVLTNISLSDGGSSLPSSPSASGAQLEGLQADGAGVFACGPAPLVADVEAQAHFHGATFHQEVFAL